ncbi:MAG: DNA mismatch repair protein MutS [Synergistaceae bacterium]|jgi:DNA mismatch repair protein MutS|nr:DNA mismatch repair protein MutS [Synergistaceae bacterium]
MSVPEGVKITPWLAQYKKWKEEYPDALLLFRMGDFYECFFDDAREVSSILEITLTSRDSEKSIPMAGVPHHALSMYLGRLIKAGRRVAICDQVGESNGKTIVERRVVRVVTPGTYVPEESENTGRLAAVFPVKDASTKDGAPKNTLAVALLSTETGRLEAGTLPGDEAAALISAFAPGEVLYPANVKPESFPPSVRSLSLLPQSNELFKNSLAVSRLKSVLPAPLESYGISEGDPSLGAAWAMLDYLSSTQFSAVRHVLRVTPLRSDDHMYLDEAARKNLDLMPEASPDNSLFSCLNRCRTPMGRRTLRDWLSRPLMDLRAIGKRQDYVGCLVSNPMALDDLQDLLAACRDVERCLSRLCLAAGTPKDLGNIRDTLRILPRLRGFSLTEPLAEVPRALPDLGALSEFLEGALEENLPRALGAGAVVRSSFHEELGSWRSVSENGEAWLAEYLKKEREATGSPRLKTGYNKVFGYYLEIGRAGLETLPPRYERRQTLANAERFVTPELREFQDKMDRSEGEIARIEGELLREITERVIGSGLDLQLLGRLLGLLDCVASLARVARERGYVKPGVNDSRNLEIRGGRHPVLETTLSDSSFVPNDVTLDETRIVILTGPNMAGKSTWLRMTALLSIMAQAGSWIPAESAAIGLVDRVFTRIGARDDLVRGNSTFMVEMLETADILNNVTDRSLVILDEVGRGTATWDGMSIAWAILEHLHHGGGLSPRVLFATHYHELTCLEERLEGVKNYSMAVSEGDQGILFLHQVIPRPADRSYGIEVARLAGLPKPVLRRAFELLELFEREGFERSSVPDPLPLTRLREQLTLFSPEADAVVEELADLDVDNLTPMRAMETLYKLKEKSRKASRHEH